MIIWITIFTRRKKSYWWWASGPTKDFENDADEKDSFGNAAYPAELVDPSLINQQGTFGNKGTDLLAQTSDDPISCPSVSWVPTN